MDTWDKKVKVNKKNVPKWKVRDYYKKLWEKDPGFRANLRKKGLFIRAWYNGKPTIIRKGIRVKDWNDVEELVKDHAVELHLPAKKYKYESYVDIDMPPRYMPKKKQIAHSLVDKLKRRKVNVALVVDSPSGVHIFSNTRRAKLTDVLKEIANDDKRFVVRKSSRTKITLDPTEPNTAVPGSLSYKGKPYRSW